MGKNNRQRRAAKKKRERHAPASAAHGHRGTVGERSDADRRDDRRDARPDDPGVIDPTVREVLQSGDEDRLHELIVETTCGVFWNHVCAPFSSIRVSRLPAEVTRYHDEMRAPERSAVQAKIASWFAEQLAVAWSRHWTPDDLVQICRRELDVDHARLLTVLMIEQVARLPKVSAMPALWRSQLEALADDVSFVLDELLSEPSSDWYERSARRTALQGAELWTASLQLVRLCMRVPAIEDICPPPSRWIAGVTTLVDDGTIDAKLLHRVRSLLAKAESTTFEEEADSLTAKAQELMARHAIDQAVVDRNQATRRVTPNGRRVWLDNPYADNKSVLLSRVAQANRCAAVFTANLGFSTVIGFAADLEVVDLLFTSLLVQGSAAVHAAGSVKDRHGVSRTRSFRSTFWLSYAIRVGERLEQTNQEVMDEAVVEHGASLLPVLAAREEEVQEAFAAAFPRVSHKSVRFSNSAGYHAGRVAADQADLAVGKRLKPTG